MGTLIIKHVARFAHDLEYALILILVTFAIVGGCTALRTGLNGLFNAGQFSSFKVMAR
jgi:Flp pilus assembly pilin Flp